MSRELFKSSFLCTICLFGWTVLLVDAFMPGASQPISSHYYSQVLMVAKSMPKQSWTPKSTSRKETSDTSSTSKKFIPTSPSLAANIDDFISAVKNFAFVNFRSQSYYNDRDSVIKSVEERLITSIESKKLLTVYQSTDLIWSSGKMKVRYQTHSGLVKLLVYQFLGQNKFDCKSLSSALIGFSSMGVKLSNLDAKQQMKLHQIILSIADFDAWGVANIIYALGVMSDSQDLLPPQVTELLQLLTERHISTMRNQGVANTIYGMGLLGWSWQSLSTNCRSLINSMLHRELPTMNSQAIANTFYGLGKMNFTFNGADPNLRSLILSAHDAVLDELNTIGLSCALFGLANMGVSFDDWPDPSQQRILSALMTLIPTMDTRALSGVLASLGKMELLWTTIQTEPIAAVILQALQKQVKLMPGRELALTVYGFSLWKIHWSILPLSLRKDVVMVLKQTATQLDSKDLVSFLYGLGKMHCCLVQRRLPAYDLDFIEDNPAILAELQVEAIQRQELQAVLFPLIYHRVESLQMEEVGAVLYSLGRLVPGGYISCLPTELRQMLQAKIMSISDVVNEQALSNAIFGLAKMGAQWSRFPPALQMSLSKALKRRLETMTTYGLCNTLRGLVTIGFSWKNAGPMDLHRLRLQQSIATAMNSMSERGVADTLGALAAMDASWNTLSRDTKLALCKALMEAIGTDDNSLSISMTTQNRRKQQRWPSKNAFGQALQEARTQSPPMLSAVNSESNSPNSKDNSNHNSNSKQLNIAELCTMMHSLAVLTFDVDYSRGYSDLSIVQQAAVNGSDAESTMLLYFAHGRLLSAYRSLLADCLQPIDDGNQRRSNNNNAGVLECHLLLDELTIKQWTQLAIYFTMMTTVHPNSKQLTYDILGDIAPPDLNQFPLDKAVQHLPSQFHIRVERSLQQELQLLTSSLNDTDTQQVFTLMSEFRGLGKFLPMDIAVMSNDPSIPQPIALVEVDGDFHYTAALAPDLDDENDEDKVSDVRQLRKVQSSLQQQTQSLKGLSTKNSSSKAPPPQTLYSPALRRIDRMKEFLYKKAFPHAKMHRVTLRSVRNYGLRTVCNNLAWIIVAAATEGATGIEKE